MHTCLGNKKAGCRGNDQCRNLGDKAIADGQQRVVVGGLGKGQLHLCNTDEDATENVDEGDQKAGNGVAAHEFGRTVHGPEEGAFILERLAARLGFGFVDEACGQIRIDRHLLARHGIQGKACRDFRDTAGTLGDDDEVHDHQDREDDDPDDEVPAHDEIAEGLNDVARRRSAFMPVCQDKPGGGNIETKPQHGRNRSSRSPGSRRR